MARPALPTGDVLGDLADQLLDIPFPAHPTSLSPLLSEVRMALEAVGVGYARRVGDESWFVESYVGRGSVTAVEPPLDTGPGAAGVLPPDLFDRPGYREGSITLDLTAVTDRALFSPAALGWYERSGVRCGLFHAAHGEIGRAHV